MTMRI
ncbi:cysteine--tRNA ligase, partial [Chlamydia psittaci 06-1683]